MCFKAKKLWARLNLDPSVLSSGPYNAMDALWQHPESRAVFYVGNQTAASNLGLLHKNGVTHVVNCTDNMPNYHENTPGSFIKYYRFDISSFHRLVKSDADAARFVQPMLDWVGATAFFFFAWRSFLATNPSLFFAPVPLLCQLLGQVPHWGVGRM